MGYRKLNNDPQRHQVLIPGTGRCHLILKKNQVFADVTKLGILRQIILYYTSGHYMKLQVSLQEKRASLVA